MKPLFQCFNDLLTSLGTVEWESIRTPSTVQLTESKRKSSKFGSFNGIVRKIPYSNQLSKRFMNNLLIDYLSAILR